MTCLCLSPSHVSTYRPPPSHLSSASVKVHTARFLRVQQSEISYANVRCSAQYLHSLSCYRPKLNLAKKVTPGPGITESSPSKLSTPLLRWGNLLLALLPRVQWGIIFLPRRGRNVPCSLPPSFFLFMCRVLSFSLYVPLRTRIHVLYCTLLP